MSRKLTERTLKIRKYLIDAVRSGDHELVSNASDKFNISRQAIHRHLATLVKEKRLIATGHTRARIYSLGPVRSHYAAYPLKDLDEHIIHRRDFSFIFEDLIGTVSEICHYGFTEILNNAMDHSEGNTVHISADRDLNNIVIQIIDDGEGIFRRIARLLNLPDQRESLLELSKGKLTTDPENHTGEGIFFTSRVFDYFFIESGDLCFTHHIDLDRDVLLHNDTTHDGTRVYMKISTDSERDLNQIFDEFSGGPDDYRFERTIVPVRLALYEGENLVSRSQAKRILNRVERFRSVVLDFEGVDKIGQAFADEVFRVFTNKNPEIDLIPINDSPRVKSMISRVSNNN
jgi:anti-sigma regulatory factor (Ser/Thr protein kinase)